MSPIIQPVLQIARPSLPLRPFISHYWLNLHNIDETYTVLPDGTVDWVIKVCGPQVDSRVYGTTTTHVVLPIQTHCHYLGICFRPGQCRHFFKAIAIDELTNTHSTTHGLLACSLADIPERMGGDNLFSGIDRVLEAHLAKHPPVYSAIDHAIHHIQSNAGNLRMSETAEQFGKSQRQFERAFLQTVGVSAKFFALIQRFHHAANLLTQTRLSLADVAAQAGYTDQSHMNHAFKRLAKISPANFTEAYVEFLQDPQWLWLDNAFSTHLLHRGDKT